MEITTVRAYNRGEGDQHPNWGSSAASGAMNPHPHEGWQLSALEAYVGVTDSALGQQCGHIHSQARFAHKYDAPGPASNLATTSTQFKSCSASSVRSPDQQVVFSCDAAFDTGSSTAWRPVPAGAV